MGLRRLRHSPLGPGPEAERSRSGCLASGPGGGALPGNPSPPQRAAARKRLPARKQQLRARQHQLVPGPATATSSSPRRRLLLNRGQPARPSPLLRRKSGEGLACAAAPLGEKASPRKGAARRATGRKNPVSRR